MLSKEIITNHIKCLKEQVIIEKELETGSDAYCEIEIEKYKQVLKDLEILEILKPMVKAIIEMKGKSINALDFNISDSVKEKIMRWLENDK